MIKYTNEQLLDMIQQYALTYNNVPTVDKMLVSKELFRRRFGSFSKAVELAGLTPNRRTREQMERKCEKCHTKFVAISKKQRYCGHSCAAQESNKQRQLVTNPNWNRPKYCCVVCFQLSTNQKFCSRECQRQHRERQYETGKITSRRILRQQLINVNGYKCSNCSISEWKGHRIVLELDHIDGDPSNNSPLNLRLLCPNCHSVTPSWKWRNKGFGRRSRKLPVS